MNLQTKKKIAYLVSAIFNPGILALVILIVAVIKSPISRIETICWILAILVLNGIIPVLVYLFFTSRGYVFDDTLHNKKVHRERIIIFGLFLVLACWELLMLVVTKNFYQPFLAVLIGGIISISIAGIVSYFWKMSMHSSMITFFVIMFMLMFDYQKVWPLIVFIPIVWWARLILHRHTIWQLLGGFIFSIVVIIATFNYFGMLNIFR